MNSPLTFVVGLRAHRLAIVACFVFQREFSRVAFFGLLQQYRHKADTPSAPPSVLSEKRRT